MGTSCLQALRILTLEPERLKNRSTTLRTRVIEDGKGSYPRRSSGLRVQFVDIEVFSPFFHSVSVIAAILRASVSRTMVGSMPLASERW